jgi:hypothetical protein
MVLLVVCACNAPVVRLALLLDLPALLRAKPVLPVFSALQDPRSIQLFAQQDHIAWPIAPPLHVTLVFSAQQERNLFKITTPSALLVCTVLPALLLFAAPLAPSQL